MNYNVSMRIRRCAGFTLIELVATIVVIVIVSAVAVDHFGTVSNGAKNAVIDDFIRDCRTVYAKMYYGDSSSGFQGTNFICLKSYVSVGGLDGATAQLSGSQLIVASLPVTFLKNQATTIIIDYGAQTYNGDDEPTFLSKAHW